MICRFGNIFWLLIGLFPTLTQAAVTVAVVTPKAGVYVAEGTELLAGAQKAVDEINEAGGLLKQKINILPIDDQCSNNIAISTAQMLSLQLRLKDHKLYDHQYIIDHPFDKEL